ncbi:MAG: hypothetical protein KF744_07990 [Taibaiella sp.]|nr:hypothetical protein [Taibaiella sp.]
MLDNEIICKYCDEVLSELNKYVDTYSKRNVCYAIGEYRDIVDRDVFVELNIPVEYVKPIVKIFQEYRLIELYPRKEPLAKNGMISECKWIGLNDDGRHFVQTQSFLISYQKEIEKQENEKIEIEKTKQDIVIGKWLIRTKWMPFVVSTATAIWTILTFIYERNAKHEQQQQIESLQSKLEATKSEIYKRMDSFYQTTHTSDTTKKK